MLADILAELDGKIIIVCVNNFLAHWARTNYGSLHVKADKVEYMPLEHFIKRRPDKNIHVIFDEIDQMLGVKSFSMLEEGDQVTAVYQASLMKEWKSVIGFSGTIADSTISQIRAELKDPICIDIPSLRKQNNDNEVVMVIQAEEAAINKKVIERVRELKTCTINFIVILKNPESLQSL